MPDAIFFNEGRQVVEDTGWPTSLKFDLSTKDCATFVATDVYSGRAPITGTGYAQATQAEPAASGLGRKLFSLIAWATGAAVDWLSPKSIVISDGTKIIAAFNLVPGGAARDMSQANTTLNVTPDYNPTNPP